MQSKVPKLIYSTINNELCPVSLFVILNLNIQNVLYYFKSHSALAAVAQRVGALHHALEGHGLNSWLGNLPRFLVQSPVKVIAEGNQLMYLSHSSVSLSPFLLPSLNK